MSRRTTTRLISKLGENHDEKVNCWKDELLKNLKVSMHIVYLPIIIIIFTILLQEVTTKVPTKVPIIRTSEMFNQSEDSSSSSDTEDEIRSEEAETFEDDYSFSLVTDSTDSNPDTSDDETSPSKAEEPPSVSNAIVRTTREEEELIAKIFSYIFVGDNLDEFIKPRYVDRTAK